MTITKIVTDNDGVNINSEDLAMRIMDDEGMLLIRTYRPELLSEIPLNHIYKTFPGKSTDKIVKAIIEGDWDKTDQPNVERALPLALIAKDHGLDETATIDKVSTHIADLITIATIKRFSQELKAVPGTTEAWQSLSQTFGAACLALATTSRADRMDVSLNHAINPETGENARLHEYFPEGKRRFSGYGGPNKYDAFFAQSGWNPAECAIVEDSDSGVAYAKAGRPDTKVIGTVAANFFVDKDAQATKLLSKGADIVISTMHDLPNAVQWLNDGMDPHKRPDFQGAIYLPSDRGHIVAPAPTL
jgi:phosphoglycolate phosphatase-like HAD superfamily hydrolase